MYKNEKTSDEENSSFDQSLEMSLFSDESESRNRISAFSKVNFTKLSAAEKEERLKNLAKLIKKKFIIFSTILNLWSGQIFFL